MELTFTVDVQKEDSHLIGELIRRDFFVKLPWEMIPDEEEKLECSPMVFPCEKLTLTRLLWRTNSGEDPNDLVGGGLLRDWYGLNVMLAYTDSTIALEIAKGSHVLRSLVGDIWSIDWCDSRQEG